MNQFVWKDAFNIGISDIDRQHRDFMNLLNTSEKKIAAMAGSGINQSIFDQLKRYASDHFRLEEKLMEEYNYPELKKQRRMHEYFETQMSKMESSLENIAPNRMFTFMKQWLLEHIMEEDMQFAKYLKS
jgi:hemerythrin-like metal-binding protein